MGDDDMGSRKVPPFLRKVFLSKRELRLILELLRANAGDELPPWKEKLINKIDKHLQKAKSYRGKKRGPGDC